MGKDSKEARLQKQRRWMRLESRASIHYRIGSEDTFKAGLARDISEGGIKFETNRWIPLQTILWLVIQLPLQVKSLKTKAEVVSAREAETNGSYEIGARFLDIRERTRSRIA
ncbi:PilZ domain-containing protein, partial [candidate division NPL-UPA2 bacterium]|nr:PilZ domain-containing protein [candidate division NPL-UPA2 bacterium]